MSNALAKGWAAHSNWAVMVWGCGEAASVVYYARYTNALNACQRASDHQKSSYLAPGPDNKGEYPTGYFVPGSNVRQQVSRATETEQMSRHHLFPASVVRSKR